MSLYWRNTFRQIIFTLILLEYFLIISIDSYNVFGQHISNFFDEDESDVVIDNNLIKIYNEEYYPLFASNVVSNDELIWYYE